MRVRLPLLVAVLIVVPLVAGWLTGGPEAAMRAWDRARLGMGRAQTPQERELLALPETPGWDRTRIVEEFVWVERYFERTFFKSSRNEPEALGWILGLFLDPARDSHLDAYATWVTPQKMAMLAADQARAGAGLTPDAVPAHLAALGYPDPQVATFAALYRAYLARADSGPPPGEPVSEIVSRYLTGR